MMIDVVFLVSFLLVPLSIGIIGKKVLIDRMWSCSNSIGWSGEIKAHGPIMYMTMYLWYGNHKTVEREF